MVLYSVADHNILGQKFKESQIRRKVARKVHQESRVKASTTYLQPEALFKYKLPKIFDEVTVDRGHISRIYHHALL
jgi:hypothetical protein